jgi:hypothetical protein
MLDSRSQEALYSTYVSKTHYNANGRVWYVEDPEGRKIVEFDYDDDNSANPIANTGRKLSESR